MKRLFIALALPEETLQTVHDFLEPYKQDPALETARWLPKESLHLTALFLGEVEDVLVPTITQIARGVCGRMHPFQIPFAQVTLFPYKTTAKMIWLRYQKSLAFEELAGELKRFLLPMIPKLADEEKYPLPHVTLARLKEAIDPKSVHFDELILPPLLVSEAGLYESPLKSDEGGYKLLEKFSYGV